MSDEFRVGVASVDMSPDRPELLRVAGLHREHPTRGVLEGNGLWVDAMAFQAGGQTAVVGTCDTGGFGRWYEGDIPKAVAERTGVEAKLVIMTGRHNHSCQARPIDPKNPEAVQARKDYREKVRSSMIEACAGAVAGLRPAEIAAATATVTEPIGQNRRARFGHGGSMPCWGTGPVAIPGEKFAPQPGPDSKRIDFLVARRPGADKPFGILTSYASHVHLSAVPYFTGEAVGGIKDALKKRIPGLTVVYGTTTGGDLDMHCTHPIPPGGVEREIEWFKESCRELGRRFADALVPTIPAGGYIRPESLGHEYFSSDGHKTDRRKRDYMINAIRLGNIAIASIPAEMFIDLVNRMYDESPIEHLLLLGFNGSGWLGYIGTPLAYEQGGYEMGKGPAPSPEEEERMIAASEKKRIIGKARIDTGVEITQTMRQVLSRLAR